MRTSRRTLTPVFRIAKHTFIDEALQKSFVIMVVVCATGLFLVRGCYQGNYMLNGQYLDSETVARTLSKVAFHVIGAGAMIITALLSMRIFRRDRNEGVQACILSKPIDRWQYVLGKTLGLWVLSVVIMFILNSIICIITSINLNVFMPEYLVASLLCSVNLLFVVITVFLLSLLMPDIIAFLCVLGIGVIGFVAEGVAAVSQSQVAQAMMQQSGAHPQTNLTWWKVVYYLWPKLSGVQQAASSWIDNGPYHVSGPVHPLVNVVLYCLVLGTLLFRRFNSEDIA